MADDRLESLQKITDILVFRLERLSVDSFWAHRASGIRGSLLRCKDELEQMDNLNDRSDAAKARRQKVEKQLYGLMTTGYQILENGAKEIRSPDGT
jgi:hypothetical protein